MIPHACQTQITFSGPPVFSLTQTYYGFSLPNILQTFAFTIPGFKVKIASPL